MGASELQVNTFGLLQGHKPEKCLKSDISALKEKSYFFVTPPNACIDVMPTPKSRLFRALEGSGPTCAPIAHMASKRLMNVNALTGTDTSTAYNR